MNDNSDFYQLLHEYERAVDRAGVPLYMDAESFLDIVDYYQKNNRTIDAEICLRYAERLHPDNENVQISRAYRLKDEGKWNEALHIIRSVRDQNAHDVQLFYFEEKLSIFDLDSAERCLHRLMQSNDAYGDYDLYLDIAEIYMDYGLFSKASTWLKEISESHPCYIRSQELSAECYEKNGDYPQAISILQSLIDAQPYNDNYWRELAEVQEFSGELQEAAESLQYALAIQPDNELTLRQNAALHVMAYPKLSLSGEITEYILSHDNDYTLSLSFAEAVLSDAIRDNTTIWYEKGTQALRNALRSCPLYAAEKQTIVITLSVYLTIGNQMQQAQHLLDVAAVDLGLSRNDLYAQVINILREGGSPPA